jgi:hypothetical protein
MNNSVSKYLEEEPYNFGMRGDPHLWLEWEAIYHTGKSHF